MASPIPDQLKKHDLGRFAQRAAQLDKLKPVVAYWCYYWILKQILSKGLEKTDGQCAAYAGSLMDHVEQIKSQHPTEDALNDDVAAQLYIEQFGLETFDRGDKAIQGNHVTRQTADTLQAAATFLEIVNIWNAPSAELASKIKYAKFHALRIVKAIKAGEDPNLSNPPPPETQPPAAAAEDIPLDPDDPEVQAINKAAAQQPSVADAPDIDAGHSSLATALDDSRGEGAVSPLGAGSDVDPHAQSTDPSIAPNPRAGSTGGGYFPEIPATPTPPPPTSAVAPAPAPVPAPHIRQPVEHQAAPSAEDFYAATSPPTHPQPPPQAPPQPAPQHPTQPRAPPTAPPPPASVPHRPAHAVPTPTPPAAPPAPAPSGSAPDDVAVAAAQKHARWAISALNFEDVPTAIRELRAAIQRLGGDA